LVVIASFVSPTEYLRKMIQDIIKNLKMIYIKCSFEECARRDVKGMYKKAMAGEIKGFTNVHNSYEEPLSPYMVVDTEHNNLGQCVKQILNNLS